MRDRLPAATGRSAARGSVFRCGYCGGRVRAADGRLVKVRGKAQMVHASHPVRAGE